METHTEVCNFSVAGERSMCMLKIQIPCCVDKILLCTHALFTASDSNFARLVQTLYKYVRYTRTHLYMRTSKSI